MSVSVLEQNLDKIISETVLGRNLRKLMKLHGHLTLSEVSRATQIPQPTLHHMLSGTTKKPRRHALQALAGYFGVTIDQLLGNQALPDVIPNNIRQELNLCYIPILGWDDALHWPNYAVREQQEGKQTQLIMEKVSHFHGFAVLLEDAHPEPLFPKGTLLIFDKDRKFSSQDFVLIHAANRNRLQLCRLIIEDGNYYTVQNTGNGDQNLQQIDRYHDRIIATLVESRIRFHNQTYSHF